jgi:hypothetical protein
MLGSKLAFNKRRPKFTRPGTYLKGELQNLFDLGYFHGAKELVPSGWGEIDEDKSYPTLASRSPQLHHTMEDESSNEYDMASARAGSESSNDADLDHQHAFASTTRMNEESDEDELAADPVNNNQRVSLIPCAIFCSILPASFHIAPFHENPRRYSDRRLGSSCPTCKICRKSRSKT